MSVESDREERTILVTETSSMDRLTQAQNAINDLVGIMASSVHYLTTKVNFKQVNADVPVTQGNPNADRPSVFEANRRELVTDLMRKAKQLEYLVSALPNPPSTNDFANVFAELEAESEIVNREYASALDEAEELDARLRDVMRTLLDGHQAVSAAHLQSQ